MNTESQKKAVSLFFFYSLMDETQALQASVKTIRQCYKTMGRLKNEESVKLIDNTTLIHATHKNWIKYKEKRGSFNALDVGWKPSTGTDLGLWRHFIRESEPEEYLTVIWSVILKFSDEEISSGIGVAPGTVRHRAGRGLKKLSSMMVTSV